jgi:hypothetical protein
MSHPPSGDIKYTQHDRRDAKKFLPPTNVCALDPVGTNVCLMCATWRYAASESSSSHDGDDVEWEVDSDESQEENGMPTTRIPLFPTLSHSCPPSPDPSNFRRSARSAKGVRTPFYGYYTSIKEQLKLFSNPGVEAIQPIEKTKSTQIFLKQKYKPDGNRAA